ncbi:hypothetical protein [Halorussus sp. AFM4]|uniref:hypothetical protein n=1 Tax=Halorussus sp. AFM4 TaxID=3421651 RepID=UPI003EBB6499
MDRRTALQSLAGGTALALAGCTGRDSATSPTSSAGTSTGARTTEARTTTSATTVDLQSHTVTVTKRVEQGQRDLSRVVRIAARRAESTLTCPDGTEKTTSADLPDERWRAFERSVLAADPSRFASEYECSGSCPQDLPQTRLTLTVDGESTAVRIEAGAELPPELDAILADVESFETNLDEPSCE